MKFDKNNTYGKKYHTNTEIFKTIDNEEKAYWLGFLYADGNVIYSSENNKYQLRLELGGLDKLHLEKFKLFAQTDRPLYKNNKIDAYSLCLSNKEICSDIIRLGCMPCKSFKIRFPNVNQVPEHLIRHFIRGYFDGDGCITYNQKNINSCNINIVSNFKFCKDLNTILCKNIGIKTKKMRKFPSKRNHKLYYSILAFYGAKNVKLIYDYIYDNANLFLERKKKKFDTFFLLKNEQKLQENKRSKYFNIFLQSPNGERIKVETYAQIKKFGGPNKQVIYRMINGNVKSKSKWKLLSYEEK